MQSTPWPIVTTIDHIEDPRIQRIAKRSRDIALIAAAKAVLHASDPRRYPIGTIRQGYGLERAFLQRFKSLDKKKRGAVIGRTGRAISDPGHWQRRVGKLARVVKLDRKVSVAKQVKKFPYSRNERIPLEVFQNLEIGNVVRHHSTADSIRQSWIDRIPEVVAAEPNNRLDVRINTVKCIDETGNYWEEKLGGADEIFLGGTAIDSLGNVVKKPAFKVDDFEEDGQWKGYAPPKVFHTFDLLPGMGFPKSFAFLFALSEQDLGGFGKFLNKLADELRPIIQAEVMKAILAAGGVVAIGGLLPGIVLAVLAVCLVWVIGQVIEALKDWWNDEIFPVFSQMIEIPSLHYTIPENVIGIANFVGCGGHYQVQYSMRMYAA